INWDATNFRINSISDAAGNSASTFAYASNDSVNKPAGYYVVTQISDPFGRSAGFQYDSGYTYLQQITDAAGNASKFLYDTSLDFITLLTTPYGSTSFYSATAPGGNGNLLRFTFPDGSSSVIENYLGEFKNTLFWDREATALYPMDPANQNFTHCKSTRWLFE